MVQVTFSVLT